MKRVEIMGVPFTYITQDAFVSDLDELIHQHKKAFVVTANPEIVMLANKDEKYMNALHNATHVTADGIGIVKAAKLLDNPLPERATGYDTMMGLLALANEKHYSIYLLGAKKSTLKKAVEQINLTYPNLIVAGSHDGYFDWEENNI